MRLDLGKIRTPHEHVEKVYAQEAFAGDRDVFRVVSSVTLAFEIFKDKAQFQLVGAAEGALEQLCSRCLEAFVTPVDVHFDLRYQPHTANTGEGEREIEEDDLTTAYYDNDEIDLGQLMREQFYLSLPMKPLCRDECRGLCPVCGTNRNRDACACTPAWEDPRLAVLKTLKQNG